MSENFQLRRERKAKLVGGRGERSRDSLQAGEESFVSSNTRNQATPMSDAKGSRSTTTTT